MKPRLVCRLVRTCSALTENASPRHAATCTDCQAYFHTAAALETSLRRAAPAATATPPADFDRNLLHALRTARAADTLDTSASAPSRPWRTLATAATVAAALVVGSVLFHRNSAPAPGDATIATTTTTTPAPTLTATEATALIETVESLSTRFSENVIPSAGTLIADNPLQHELTAVYTDAKSALDFLALNFLPTTAKNNTPAPARRSTG